MTRTDVEDVAGFVLAVALIGFGGLRSWLVLATGLIIGALVVRDMRAKLRGAVGSRPGERPCRASASPAAAGSEALLGALPAPSLPLSPPSDSGQGRSPNVKEQR